MHGDDTTVPVLAKGKTITGRLWTYVRDDRPFGGPAPPAAIFYYSRDRGGEHPQPASGGLCGDPAGGCLWRIQRPLLPGRKPGPITEAACWAHGRRKFFELAELRARRRWRIEAVRRIDRDLRRRARHQRAAAEQRLAVRQERVAPLVARSGDLDARLRAASCRATPTSPRRWTTC